MTAVPIANVGVVIAYVGQPGKDVTGDAFKHGNLVSRGEKGVWNEPLDPGMYPINPYTLQRGVGAHGKRRPELGGRKIGSA